MSFDFLDFHQLGRDGEGGEGFEEDGPGGKDRVGGDRGQMGEEAGSLRRGLACSDPGRLRPIMGPNQAASILFTSLTNSRR